MTSLDVVRSIKIMRVYAFLTTFLYMCGLSHLRKQITLEHCGRKDVMMARIIGGKKAEHGDYPWMVSIHENSEGYDHVCGGTILNERWILTAAHCIDHPKKPWRYRIYVGLHKLSKMTDKSVRKHKISKIIRHEDYDPETFSNDIALMRTRKPIDIWGSGGQVNGICLPLNDKDPKGYATVTGWGHTREDGRNSDTLKTLEIPIIPRSECNIAYDEDPDDDEDEVEETMICAGKTGEDSCQNDSGGPLIQNKKGVHVLIGIVSYGVGCGDSDYPGVYTKVGSFLDWIEENVY